MSDAPVRELACVHFASSAYTELAMSTVKQSQVIPFTGPYSLLVCHLRNLTGEVPSTRCFNGTLIGILHVFLFGINEVV